MARWPQPFCRRLANGCGELLHREKTQSVALPLLTHDHEASQHFPGCSDTPKKVQDLRLLQAPREEGSQNDEHFLVVEAFKKESKAAEMRLKPKETMENKAA